MSADVYAFRRNLVLAASAGTGKTHTLVGVLLHAMLGASEMGGEGAHEPVDPARIVATTFSRKAAAEIRERIVVELSALASGTPSASSYGALLAEAATFAMISEDGFILVRVVEGESEILSLGVTPAARRRGIGSALLAEALEGARARGATAMFLEVEEGNLPAIALYKRHGFAQIGCRKAYYTSPGTQPKDALVLRVQIPPAPVGNSVQLG